MKDQVEVKGFRFQVYCLEGRTHIHSPEETAKVDIGTEKAQKLIKPFMVGLKQREIGDQIAFSDLRVIILGEEKVQIRLGKERAVENKKSFIKTMQSFRRLIEDD